MYVLICKLSKIKVSTTEPIPIINIGFGIQYWNLVLVSDYKTFQIDPKCLLDSIIHHVNPKCWTIVIIHIVINWGHYNYTWLITHSIWGAMAW